MIKFIKPECCDVLLDAFKQINNERVQKNCFCLNSERIQQQISSTNNQNIRQESQMERLVAVEIVKDECQSCMRPMGIGKSTGRFVTAELQEIFVDLLSDEVSFNSF